MQSRNARPCDRTQDHEDVQPHDTHESLSAESPCLCRTGKDSCDEMPLLDSTDWCQDKIQSCTRQGTSSLLAAMLVIVSWNRYSSLNNDMQ